MRVGQPIRVYKQVVAAEITAIAAVLEQATSVNLDFSACDGIMDVGLHVIAAAMLGATIVNLDFSQRDGITDVGFQAIAVALQRATFVNLDFIALDLCRLGILFPKLRRKAEEGAVESMGADRDSTSALLVNTMPANGDSAELIGIPISC